MTQEKNKPITEKKETWLSFRISDKNEEPESKSFISELLDNKQFRELIKKHKNNPAATALERIFEFLSSETAVVEVEVNGDDFFLSEKKRLEFLIIHNDKGDFDKDVGVRRAHFVDADLAKKWRTSD